MRAFGVEITEFKKTSIAIVLCMFLAVTTACPPFSTSWVSEAEQIVAILVPAATNIVALAGLAQGGVSARDIQMIVSWSGEANKDFNIIGGLLNQYNQAAADAKPGILDQIQAAIQTAQMNLGTLLPALHVTNSDTQAKVSAGVQLVLQEVASLAALIPVLQGKSTAAHVGSPKPLTAKAFKKEYNAAINTPSLSLK
jgi:hypothetical protein